MEQTFTYSPKVLSTAYKLRITAIEIKNEQKDAVIGYIPVDNLSPKDVVLMVFRDGDMDIANYVPYQFTKSATYLREVCKMLKRADPAKLKLRQPGQINDGLYSIFKGKLGEIVTVAKYVSLKDGVSLDKAFFSVLDDYVTFEQKEYAKSKSKTINPQKYIDMESGKVNPDEFKSFMKQPAGQNF